LEYKAALFSEIRTCKVVRAMHRKGKEVGKERIGFREYRLESYPQTAGTRNTGNKRDRTMVVRNRLPSERYVQEAVIESKTGLRTGNNLENLSKGVYAMKRLFSFKMACALALVLALTIFTGAAFAEPWSFGVMADTQWKTSPDGKNPNNVAVGVITHLNQEFINHGVKFVIQTGDLTENGNNLEMDTTATFRQALYNAGIGFYPLRGNHETSAAVAAEFKRVFPQTQTGVNNQTPSDALVTTTYYGPPPANTNTTFTVGSNFSSPTAIDPNYAGLTYSFDYDNVRLVLLDGFTIPNIACNLIENQQPWISSTLSSRPAGTHAFVFGHKGLITENHKDILFTAPGGCNGSSTNSTPAVKPAEQNAFMSSLFNNGVRYYINGHDHMHNRAVVTSPDGLSAVQNITTSSNSYKFYIPIDPSSDEQYNLPAFGFLRETPVAQELFTVGYYIVTVDGPRVTVDHYSSPNGCNGDCDLTDDVIPYTFTKRETFGYSLNGKEFPVAQGASYTGVQDSYKGTTAKVLDGINGSAATVYDGRITTKTVNTGWTPKAVTKKKNDDIGSNILSLWGMADLGSNQTDVYTLSMSYDNHTLFPVEPGKGLPRLATRDENGEWVNAVDMNFGGTKKFILGPWKPGYGLGTYGIDLTRHTAWAVINHDGDFAVAGFRRFH
jgi:hypothetical protein